MTELQALIKRMERANGHGVIVYPDTVPAVLRALTALSRMEAERDKHKRALYLSIEAHSVDPRQIERLARHYLEQASGAQGEA